MREEAQAALASAGLPADYQTVPMLNFRNIASEQEGEKSLKLLDDIYPARRLAGEHLPQRGRTHQIPGVQDHSHQEQPRSTKHKSHPDGAYRQLVCVRPETRSDWTTA